ncbi:MAG: bifunctional adenosylcobinamide kinase/adenosylcobinamide-phosphate guanylyltransferase [Nitrospirae bacterium]|nr:bifunctional adenosylcobinamide kinase/adenosylcobinamide-phosphate guanylyltransferase [Nitrospirota bacterium]
MKKRIVFITGGARSGKSRFALNEASKIPGKRFFVATATAGDDEMARRIEKHRQDRSGEWETIEEPLRVAEVISAADSADAVFVIDCLTLWLSNIIDAGLDIESEADRLICLLGACHSQVFIVSNEVGLGIVPENVLARTFRDLAGFLNQRIAGAADEAYFMASGIPVKIK